jgi:hypothetical protein
LQDAALRALLSDVSVTPGAHGGLDDGPSETFLANGIYQRLAGRGSAPGEPFEIRNGAVCVPNGGSTPRCRRVHANGDGTYTFTDTVDGTATVMTVTPLGTANDGLRAFLGNDALRILLNDVSVTDIRTARGDDGPSEIFRASGTHQRIGGRGVSNEALYEIRGDTVCVRGDGASRCRRVRANGDGTWTFINTADGTSAVVTVTPLRRGPAAPLRGDALAAIGVTSQWSAGAQSFAAREQAPFAGAERVGEAELRRLLPDRRAVYARSYRGIQAEYFGTRPGAHARALRERGAYYDLSVFHDLFTSGGSYRLRGNLLCSIVLPETIERCRGVFRLRDGGYAFSSHEDPARPVVRVRLEPSGSSGR